MKHYNYLISLAILLFSASTAMATSLSGTVYLPENLTNPEPDGKVFGNAQKVLTTTYDNGNRPLVYLTGINNTEDTKPFDFEALHFDRLGARNNSAWVLKGAAIELVNDDSITLDLVIVDDQGQQQKITIQERHSFQFTAQLPGNFQIFVQNHRSEAAHLLVSSSHYVKKAGQDFSFVIDDLPPGNAIVNLWYNGVVISAAAKDIPDDGNVSICFFTNNEGSLIGDSCDNAKKNKRH